MLIGLIGGGVKGNFQNEHYEYTFISYKYDVEDLKSGKINKDLVFNILYNNNSLIEYEQFK